MVSQDKSQGLAFIFKSSERKILLSATPWIKIIHFFLHRNLNRGSRWYLTTWRTTRFFSSPLRHSCFKSVYYSAYERKAIKASTSLLFPLTSQMRNIFQMGFFYFLLIAFKWIPWSKGKKEKIQIWFFGVLCRMMQVIWFHTHTGPILSICLILWKILPANIIASGFMDFIRQTLLSFLSTFSGLYNF